MIKVKTIFNKETSNINEIGQFADLIQLSVDVTIRRNQPVPDDPYKCTGMPVRKRIFHRIIPVIIAELVGGGGASHIFLVMAPSSANSVKIILSPCGILVDSAVVQAGYALLLLARPSRHRPPGTGVPACHGAGNLVRHVSIPSWNR
jgi:hypothetical protein